MKTLLNKVIEAEKEAAANVILRREGDGRDPPARQNGEAHGRAAATPAAEELDSLKEMAAKVQEVRLVVGSNARTGLVPSEFFAETRDREAKTGES